MDLKAKPYENIDPAAIQGIAKFYDCAKDDAMNNTRRPGLLSAIDLGESAAVDSVYEWEFQNWLVSVCNGKLFKTTKAGAVYTTIEITGATLEIGTPATFADFGATLYMANGGKIVKWAAADATCSYVTDVDAPTTVTHVAFIDQYLIALSDGVNYFSDVNDPDTWLGEFFTAERLRDKTTAMHTAFSEISSFGSLSVEYHGNTGNASLPFQRYEGAITQRGVIAPYSVQQIDNTYFFLDQERKVVKLNGRDPQVISTPFDSVFQGLGTVTDAIGMDITTGGDTWYVLTFPTEDRTFAYDYKRDVFSEWSYFNNGSGLREAFLGRSSSFVRTWNDHFVGSRKADGLIFTCSKEIYADNTDSMVFELWTGWQGAGGWVEVPELMLTIRRGDGAALTVPEPTIDIYYRDSNANPGGSDSTWKGPRSVNLGQLGEAEQQYRVHRLGRYRKRQYRFRCSSDVPIVLIAAEERLV